MTDEKKVTETSEAEIAVHWQEEEYYHPSPTFTGQRQGRLREILTYMICDQLIS